MRVEENGGVRSQFADEGKWLFNEENGTRQFTKSVMLGKEAQLLEECTEQEKQKYEAEQEALLAAEAEKEEKAQNEKGGEA